MHVYVGRNPVMIQQLETSQVVEREGLEKQNTWNKWSRRTQKMMKFWAFLKQKIMEKIDTPTTPTPPPSPPIFESVMLDQKCCKAIGYRSHNVYLT